MLVFLTVPRRGAIINIEDSDACLATLLAVASDYAAGFMFRMHSPPAKSGLGFLRAVP